ncbi:MAG: squalene synthase HpnC [Gammaproteobacteria bacterium]|nr:squalene synthase HpnC [Gammaproteobacteria bacterium]
MATAGSAGDIMSSELDAAYRHCRQLARSHYENFPVASLLLPRAVRAPVAVIYAFARTADDFADEGNLPPEERLARLESFGQGLDAALSGRPAGDPVLLATADIIRRHRLAATLFHDLLTAFRMDVTKHRYADFAEVLGYCRYSANPVGRLILHLTGRASSENLSSSDAVCSGLQLVNFLQDLAQDYEENGRIYLPEDEMRRFGVDESHIRDRRTDAAMRRLFRHQVQRARKLLATGAPLGARLPGRLGLEIRAIIAGGLQTADKLAALDEDVFARPRLSTADRLGLLWHAWRRPPYPSPTGA